MDPTAAAHLSQICVTIEVETPTIPNFIRVKVGNVTSSIPIEDLTDDQLHQVAKSWHAQLLATAHKKRSLAREWY